MRHLVRKSKLNKAADHRHAMLKNLAAQVIQYEHIDTTVAKAKALQPIVDKIINVGKKQDLQARRELAVLLYDELAIKKVLEVLSTRYDKRSSGFTSLIKIGVRHGDNAQLARVMLLES